MTVAANGAAALTRVAGLETSSNLATSTSLATQAGSTASDANAVAIGRTAAKGNPDQ